MIGASGSSSTDSKGIGASRGTAVTTLACSAKTIGSRSDARARAPYPRAQGIPAWGGFYAGGVELDFARADLDDVLTGADAVIHLAAQPGVRLSWSDGFAVHVERNLTASQRRLEAARRTRVPRLVLASSSPVFGTAPEQPITKGASTRPFSPY